MPMESSPPSSGSHVPIENFRQRYRLGCTTVVLSSNVDISETEQLLLRTIRLVETSDQRPGLQHTDLLLEFLSSDINLKTPETIGETTATDDLKGRQTLDGYFWWCGDSTLQVFSDEARVVVQIRSCFRTYSLYLRRQFFLMAFYMMLRAKGQYCLHANGVVYRKKPCLIAGISGSGKSTLALNLALQGWQFWGDDTMVMRLDEEGHVSGLALRCGSACSLKTASITAQAKAFYENAPALQDDKRLLAVESMNGVTVVPEAIPEILIFPTIQDRKLSMLERVDQTSTMAHLIALSAGILTNRVEVEFQMALLEKLTRQANAYSMVLGRDAIDEPERVAALLAGTVMSN